MATPNDDALTVAVAIEERGPSTAADLGQALRWRAPRVAHALVAAQDAELVVSPGRGPLWRLRDAHDRETETGPRLQRPPSERSFPTGEPVEF